MPEHLPLPTRRHAVIIGGGPAGLMAAEVLSAAGLAVDVHDAMPSMGRKFLLAGVGGMNISHAEDTDTFIRRYGSRSATLEPMIRAFDAAAIRQWAAGLGIETFVGSSGKIFPKEMKAAPLLRAWLARLRASGVHLHVRHRWLGWNADGTLRIAGPEGESAVGYDVLVLALGGASWKKLGSDGQWVAPLSARQVDIAPLRPANCGFDIGWTPHLSERFAGHALKSVTMTFEGQTRRGECVITGGGIEGQLVYGFAAALRDAIERDGIACPTLDLAPDKSESRLADELGRPRGAASMANHLRRTTGIEGVRAALLRECLPRATFDSATALAHGIKHLPLRLLAPRPIDEAISTAGGVRFEGLDDGLMLDPLPGVFCAGEMLDWEAPTGGYLLTACLATGRQAAAGALAWLARNANP